jgi:hypothetical protein
MSQEQRERASEKETCGLKKEKITRKRRKLHNEELHNMYHSPNIIMKIKSRTIRCVGNAARMGRRENSYNSLDENPEGKRTLGRPRCKWKDNIKMGLIT